MALAKKCDRCGTFHNNYNEAQNSKKINAIMTLNTDEYNNFFLTRNTISVLIVNKIFGNG